MDGGAAFVVQRLLVALNRHRLPRLVTSDGVAVRIEDRGVQLRLVSRLMTRPWLS